MCADVGNRHVGKCLAFNCIDLRNRVSAPIGPQGEVEVTLVRGGGSWTECVKGISVNCVLPVPVLC